MSARATVVLAVVASLCSCGGEAAPGGSGAAGGEAAPDGAAQARDTALRRMAEEALPRIEEAAGLEFARAPRLARSRRERLEAFLTSELERQLPPERAEATAAAYARLGLLPDTLDLRELMRSLYLEQVVGYYSPDADTLFVRDDVSGATLEPVLVHEMVHALQDQHMDLDSLLAARRGANDALTAAHAALEGHAMFVMLEDVLRQRTGGDVDLGALDLGALMEGVDLAELAGASELSGAPRVVRESLVFPYTGGLTFVQAFWRARDGRPPPLGDDVPASTEQILHPDRFTASDRDAPAAVAFPGGAPGGWREVHADGLGEFEIRLFLDEFLADSARAREAAAGWDGDRYRLLRSGDGAEALVWASVWDADDEADEFAGAAEAAFRERYGTADGGDGRRVRIRRETVGSRPVVVVVDAPSGVELPSGASRLELEEGPVP